MKALNYKEINQKFTRFLAWFVSLLLVISFCVYSFLHTWHGQINNLIQKKEQYSQLTLVNIRLANKVDSLIMYMNRLNGNFVYQGQDRYIQQAIIKQKQALLAILHQQPQHQKYYAVYNRLAEHINDIVILKDSVNGAKTNVAQLRFDLSQCINATKEGQSKSQKK